MINRLRRWFYRRIEGPPVTPLSVLSHGPYTISDLEGMRGGFSRLGGHNDFGPRHFDHDAVQLQADESQDWPGEYTEESSMHYMLVWPNPFIPPLPPGTKRFFTAEELMDELGVDPKYRQGHRADHVAYDEAYDYHLGSDY